jgi:hypothetical protein
MEWTVSQKQLNGIVARQREVRREIKSETREVEGKARSNLAMARAATPWVKIADPSGLTDVYGIMGGPGQYDDVDGFVYLQAPNAFAIEFGHAPSGVFGPDGRYADVETRSPHGLYILTRAAGMPRLNYTVAGTNPKRGPLPTKRRKRKNKRYKKRKRVYQD